MTQVALDGGGGGQVVLVSGGGDGKLRVWAVADGRCLATVDAHATPIRATATCGAGILATGRSSRTTPPIV